MVGSPDPDLDAQRIERIASLGGFGRIEARADLAAPCLKVSEALLAGGPTRTAVEDLLALVTERSLLRSQGFNLRNDRRGRVWIIEQFRRAR